MSYQVGQVLFLLSRKDKKVIPVQVIEQVVRKTLDEEKVSYNIRFPDKKMSESPLESIDAEVFSDISNVRALMVDGAVTAIDKIIDIASAIASDRFDLQVFEENISKQEDIDLKEVAEGLSEEISLNDFSDAQIDLGNGIKATVRSIGE